MVEEVLAKGFTFSELQNWRPAPKFNAKNQLFQNVLFGVAAEPEKNKGIVVENVAFLLGG